MKHRELVRLLLHKADQDEAVLEQLLPDPKFDDERVGFHAQQAVETADSRTIRLTAELN